MRISAFIRMNRLAVVHVILTCSFIFFFWVLNCVLWDYLKCEWVFVAYWLFMLSLCCLYVVKKFKFSGLLLIPLVVTYSDIFRHIELVSLVSVKNTHLLIHPNRNCFSGVTEGCEVQTWNIQFNNKIMCLNLTICSCFNVDTLYTRLMLVLSSVLLDKIWSDITVKVVIITGMS